MCLCCGVAHNSFLLYRGEPRRMLYQIRKMGHFEKTTSSLTYYNQQPTNETQPFKDIIQGISTMYHWRLETPIHWNN